MASDQAASLLAAAHAAEPKSERVLSWLVKIRNQQAQLALARGDTASARKHLSDAQALIEPAWQAEQNEVLRLWLARTRLLEGEVAQQEGNPAQAAVAWKQARQLLLADAENPLPFGRLDPLVRALQQLGQAAEAVPHRQRLDAAGYVPLRPFSDVERIARR